MSQTVPTYLLLEDLRTQQSGIRCENAAPDTVERRYHGPVFLASFVRLNRWLCISTCEMRSLLSCSGRLGLPGARFALRELQWYHWNVQFSPGGSVDWKSRIRAYSQRSTREFLRSLQ